MPINQTPGSTVFPYRATSQELDPNRYMSLPTPTDMKRRSLFGIPLKSFLTGDTIQDETLQNYIDMAISELEHTLDLYITPVEFVERHDYNRELQMWSFGYIKVDHSPIQTVKRFALTFNNGAQNGQVLVNVPLEFIHIQPQEGTIQLVPAQGVTVSDLIASVYSGVGFHAFNTGAIQNWPGTMEITYVAGFEKDKVPALIAGLVENMAAARFLSSLGPVLFPHNSVSISIDGTSQSTGTLGPGFLQNRLGDLEKQITAQMEAVKGYYQKRFLTEFL